MLQYLVCEASMSDVPYWVGFSKIPGIGRVRFQQLQSHFGLLQNAWEADRGELRSAGLDRGTVDKIMAQRPTISLDEEMDRLRRHGVKVLTCDDPTFPPRLKEIYDVPPILYIRGSMVDEDEWAIAVVGTRQATVYGRDVTEQLVEELVHNRITIVSGLARGIDAVAHRAALDSGGRTIAVSACGLDMVYPAENTRLAQSIIENGALVSEYPLGTRPKADNFFRRNRILSGLSLGVLVTEAGKRSGALITANYANEQNREVFAVPGSIQSPSSYGTNLLVQAGAKLVCNAQDMLEELNLSMIPRQLEMREIVPANETESNLIQFLGEQPTHIDEICRLSHLPIARVSSTLAMMELKGMVRQLGGMNYALARGMHGT
jgi:DNA processing protein